MVYRNLPRIFVSSLRCQQREKTRGSSVLAEPLVGRRPRLAEAHVTATHVQVPVTQPEAEEREEADLLVLASTTSRTPAPGLG